MKVQGNFKYVLDGVEIENFENREKSEKEKDRIEDEFKQECKELYLKSLKDSKMYLHEHQCTALCRMGIFSQYATKELREKFGKMAEQEYKDRVNRQKDDDKLISEIVPSAYRIAGRMFIEHCLNNGYKYVQD
jgi:hypothetical protein